MEINSNSQDNNSQAYEIAQKKVKKIKSFYIHLTVFILVNAYLLILSYTNLDANEQFFSFNTFSTVFFWGIGLFAHGFSVFVPYFILGKDWEEKKLNEYMSKEKNNK
jgi:hypothetical protein